MDIFARMNMIRLMMQELNEAVTVYARAVDQKNGRACYGELFAQPECKTAIKRKIVTIREQLNVLRQEL